MAKRQQQRRAFASETFRALPKKDRRKRMSLAEAIWRLLFSEPRKKGGKRRK